MPMLQGPLVFVIFDLVYKICPFCAVRNFICISNSTLPTHVMHNGFVYKCCNAFLYMIFISNNTYIHPFLVILKYNKYISWAHWGRVTHICVSKLDTSDSNNGLSPGRNYLHKCWNNINWTHRNKIQRNVDRNSYIFIQENACENIACKMAAIFYDTSY